MPSAARSGMRQDNSLSKDALSPICEHDRHAENTRIIVRSRSTTAIVENMWTRWGKGSSTSGCMLLRPLVLLVLIGCNGFELHVPHPPSGECPSMADAMVARGLCQDLVRVEGYQ